MDQANKCSRLFPVQPSNEVKEKYKPAFPKIALPTAWGQPFVCYTFGGLSMCRMPEKSLTSPPQRLAWALIDGKAGWGGGRPEGGQGCMIRILAVMGQRGPSARGGGQRPTLGGRQIHTEGRGGCQMSNKGLRARCRPPPKSKARRAPDGHTGGAPEEEGQPAAGQGQPHRAEAGLRGEGGGLRLDREPHRRAVEARRPLHPGRGGAHWGSEGGGRALPGPC